MSYFKNIVKQYVAEAVEELINEGMFDSIANKLLPPAPTPEQRAKEKEQINDKWAERVRKKQGHENMVKNINTPPPKIKFDFYKDLTKPNSGQ